MRARRGTLGYRAAKFVRRHRLGVAVAAVVLGLTVATAIVLADMAARVAAERDKARHVTELLIDFFENADPGAARGDEITVREAMDRGAASLDERLVGQPEVRMELLDAIARIYSNLGIYDRAASLFEQSVELRRQVLGRRHPDTFDSLAQLARVTARISRPRRSSPISRACRVTRAISTGPKRDCGKRSRSSAGSVTKELR